MPVLEPLTEAIKMGSKFTGLSAQEYGVMSAISQATVALPSLMPIGPAMIPAIPIGQAISLILNKLEALPAEIAAKLADIIAKMNAQYIKDREAAIEKRSAAEEKLFNDLKAKQQEIKDLLPEMEAELGDLEAQLSAVKAQQKKEMASYYNTVFGYAEKAKEAQANGKDDEAVAWANKVSALDGWLGEIISMSVEIVNLTLDIKFLEADIARYKRIIEKTVKKDWTYMNTLATEFEVSVPYYPDIPGMPNLPEIPQIPQEPALVRTARKQFAKWVATPTVPPIGLAVSAIMLMIVESVPNVPPVAAKAEAVADSLILKLGTCV